MIIGIFLIDLHTNKRLYRSSSPMSSSKMNYYMTEFGSLATEGEGSIQMDTYNYFYLSNNVQKIGMQVTKDHSPRKAMSLLKYIEENSTEDIFDALVTIDSLLYGGIGVNLDLNPIKELDSQEEKIYKMMLENKRLEKAQREKEARIRGISEKKEIKEPVPEIKIKKIEKSNKPVLLIIREKAKLEINKDGEVKEKSINGEIDLVISDAKYRQLQIKMKNLKPSLKYSPYLEKAALKKQILRFEKERGLNKNIPLLKWSAECKEIPIQFDLWADEEDDKVANTFEFKAKKNIKEIEFRFNRENATDVEIEEGAEEGDSIVWKAENLKKDESRIIEIKCTTFDKECLFPIEVKVVCDSLETNIDVDKVFVEENEIEEYEIRRIFEVESFVINAK